MDTAVKKHFKQDIKERKQLTGGFSFETWLLVLESEQKIIFRTAADSETSSGRKLIMADIFKREKFFYDNVNKTIGHICPTVFVIDDTREYYGNSFQISEYIEGTPLNLCFDGLDEREKHEIYYKIGEIAAGINAIEIEKHNPYVSGRGSWEAFMAARLCERLMPLVKNNVITVSEINKITCGMEHQKAEKTLSFLHLDLRFINMIYNNGGIFILDAENCEFGDPLFDLAVIDLTGNLTSSFLVGYNSVSGAEINIGSDLFYFYKLERQALVLDLYMNAIKNDEKTTRHCLNSFLELKNKII